MSKTFKFTGIFFLLVFVMVISFYIGKTFMPPAENLNNNISKVADTQSIYEDNIKHNPETIAPTETTLYKNAILTFEYHHDGSQAVDTIKDVASSSLTGLNQEEIAEIFRDYEITNFSQNAITFKKTLSANKPYHIVGIKDENVAVYYKDEKNNIILKDVLAKPIISLSADDVKKLEKGIIATDDKELLKILEDYSS